jgi:dCMP deaminase
MQTAEVWSELSKAERSKVGAVLYKDNAIISIGFNGTPSGFDNSCEYITYRSEHGHDYHPNILNICDQIDENTWKMSRGTKISKELVTKPEVLHAESNAIAKVAKSSQSCDGATLYVTLSPCLECAKIIIQCGITRVVYRHKYRITDGIDLLEKAGIQIDVG